MAVGKAGSCLTVDDDCLAAAVPASSLQRTAKNEKFGVVQLSSRLVPQCNMFLCSCMKWLLHSEVGRLPCAMCCW